MKTSRLVARIDEAIMRGELNEPFRPVQVRAMSASNFFTESCEGSTCIKRLSRSLVSCENLTAEFDKLECMLIRFSPES